MSYWADTGPGMLQGKCWAYNPGINVPMILYVLERFRRFHPSEYAEARESKQLVDFVDLVPTVLSLAGINPPHISKAMPSPGSSKLCCNCMCTLCMAAWESCNMVHNVRDERYIYSGNTRYVRGGRIVVS